MEIHNNVIRGIINDFTDGQKIRKGITLAPESKILLEDFVKYASFRIFLEEETQGRIEDLKQAHLSDTHIRRDDGEFETDEEYERACEDKINEYSEAEWREMVDQVEDRLSWSDGYTDAFNYVLESVLEDKAEEKR